MTDEKTSGGPLRRRQRVLILIVAIAVASLISSVVTARFLRSPAQEALDSAPPALTLTVVPVGRGGVTTTLALNGVVAPTYVTTIGLSGSDSGGQPVTPRVLVGASADVAAGAVVAERGPRPVFVLRGALALTRSLVPGATGTDVVQLQEALKSLGYAIGDQSGHFGGDTKAVLTAFYRDRGYSTMDVGADAVKAAVERVTAAQRAQTAAATTLKRAQRDAGSALNSDAVDDAKTALKYAGEDLAAARSALSESQAGAGPSVPLGEVQFVPELPAHVSSIAAPTDATAGVLIVSSGPLIVKADVPAQVLAQVRSGQKAKTVFRTGADTTCQVKDVTQAAATETGSAQASATLPCDTMKDASRDDPVRVLVTVAEDPGPFLVVPVTAIVTQPNGTTVVLVDEGATQRTVPVSLGTSGDGMVAVTPHSSAELAEGDQVVVGRG